MLLSVATLHQVEDTLLRFYRAKWEVVRKTPREVISK